MARIYVSSTYSDLKDCREAVARGLRRLDHHVVAMEHYVAADDRPLDKCLTDVANCDVYVGIFAWRYGFVPAKDNPTGRSITELEYEEAGRLGKPRLVFLVAEDAPWKPSQLDQVTGENEAGGRIRALRKRLADEHIASFFETPAQLESLATAAVANWEKEQARPAAVDPAAPGGPPAVPGAYLDWLRTLCASVELLGLRLRHGQSVRLTNVYVPLTTVSGSEPAENARKTTTQAARRPQPGPERELTLLLHRLGESSLYVSGDPGSGKSTFCRWTTWVTCEGAVPAPDVDAPDELLERFPETLRGRLPLHVPLRDFWSVLPDPAKTVTLSRNELEACLGAWVDGSQAGRLTGSVARAHLSHGSALLMLDGVDEVPSSHRGLLLSGLANAMPDWTRGNRVLMTSRPYGLTDADLHRIGLPAAPIQLLVPAQQDFLVKRWFRILAETNDAAEALAGDMLEQVRGQHWLEPLLANPLLLTATCIVFNDGKRLPQDKHELYDRLVDVVLSNRFRDTAQIARVRDRLTVVAHGMHTGAGLDETRPSPLAQATDDEIDRMLRAYRSAAAWEETQRRAVREDRDELVARTGVFIPVGEHRAGFYHLSFQEFFAAQRLADGEPEALAQTLLERGASPAWRNTLSFLYGKVLASSATPERPVRLLTSVVEKLTSDGCSRALVAADCLEILTRRGYGLTKPVEDRLRTLCLEVMRGPAEARVRCEVGSALGRIGDPRFRADAWFLPDDAMLGFVKIPAGPFVMGSDPKKDQGADKDEQPAHEVSLPAFYVARYPVTVAQFRAYVEDAGVTPGEPDCVRGVANHPVVTVSWHEALAYAAWLSGKLKKWPSTPRPLARVLDPKWKPARPWRVTLASEAQWEKAARGTDGRIYPWGPDADPNKANYAATGMGGTSAVGCFPGGASPHGIEDLAGNVWEWTRSLWGKAPRTTAFGYPYRPDDGREDLAAAKDTLRVVRGGSLGGPDWFVRAASRFRHMPQARDGLIGFRVVVSPFFSDL